MWSSESYLLLFGYLASSLISQYTNLIKSQNIDNADTIKTSILEVFAEILCSKILTI